MVEGKTTRELLDKAYELGYRYEKDYRGCSQCALAAIYDTLKIHDDNVFKSATGFASPAAYHG